MTEEQEHRTRQLIRESLAELTDIQAADGIRVTRLEETAQTLLAITQNLVTLAQHNEARMDRQDARMDRQDARMDKLVETIEQYVKGRGSNGTGNT